MNLRRAIGVHLSLLTCAVDGDPLLGVVVQVWQLHRVDFQRDIVDIDQLKVRLWPFISLDVFFVDIDRLNIDVISF